MIYEFGAMTVLALTLGVIVTALSRRLSGGIMISEGRSPLSYTAGQTFMDVVIISAVSFLSMLSFSSEMLAGNGMERDVNIAMMAVSGIFGALIAGAAWGDARTSITPETMVAGALASFFAVKAMTLFPGIGLWSVAGAALAGVLIYAAAVVVFQNLEGWRVPPADVAFYLIIALIPGTMTGVYLNALIAPAGWVIMSRNQDLALGLVSRRERDHLEAVLKEVYGEDSQRLRDWVPVGTFAIFVITANMAANIFLTLNGWS